GRIAKARLADTNGVLVGCYEAVRRDVDAVIDALGGLADAHRTHGSAHYYAARARFNATVADWRHADGSSVSFGAERAALLIYLNRTGFNGLFRLNSRGEFNVPAGRYSNPAICDPPGLRAAA